jgi:hypothetical protein
MDQGSSDLLRKKREEGKIDERLSSGCMYEKDEESGQLGDYRF